MQHTEGPNECLSKSPSFTCRIVGMALASKLCYFLLAVIIQEASARPGTNRRDLGSASTQVRRICFDLIYGASRRQNLTFISHVSTISSPSFNYLWKIPRALVYLSYESLALGTHERAISISWERDYKALDTFYNEFRDWTTHCGFRDCRRRTPSSIQFHQLGKFVLVQIRELARDEFIVPIRFSVGTF